MDIARTLEQARELMSSRRVFGEPYAVDGVTIVPVAKVGGGGGGGAGIGGSDGEQGGGGGGGFGAKPAGVFVIREGKVRWQPAVDVNQMALGGQIVAIVGLLVLRSVLRRRR